MGDRKYEKQEAALARIGYELMWLGENAFDLPGQVWLLEVRLKPPKPDGGEWMAVVKAVQQDNPVVAFVSAPELETLVHLVAAKLGNGSCTWREDKPYGTGR